MLRKSVEGSLRQQRGCSRGCCADPIPERQIGTFGVRRPWTSCMQCRSIPSRLKPH
jgi:hypothetical protein